MTTLAPEVCQAHLLVDPCPALTAEAHKLLVEFLRSDAAGRNDPTVEHEDALRLLLQRMTQLALGPVDERRAIPLQTGLGKTSAVRHWIIAAHRLGMLGQVSLAVCCSRVEALCELKTQLVEGGVPANLIALMHSGHPGQYSLQSDDRSTVPERPVLLATHADTEGKDPFVLDGFRNAPRSFVVWDEAMLLAEPTSVLWGALGMGVGGVGFTLGPAHPLTLFLYRAHSAISDDLEAQRIALDEDRKPRPASIRILPDGDLCEFEAALDEVAKRAECGSNGNGIAAVRILLRMARRGEARALLLENRNAVVNFEIVIPDELRRVLVLDASDPIRELAHLDQGLRHETGMPAELKRYDHVVCRFADYPTGRATSETDLSKEKSLIRATVVEAVRDASLRGESTLVVHFKDNAPKGRRRRGHGDAFVETYSDDLRQAGLDPTDVMPSGHRRVMFTNWGKHDSFNEARHCSTVVLAGTLHKSEDVLAALVAGQRRDLTTDADRAMLKQILDSEIACDVLQAMGRGTCRTVRGGLAEPMTLYWPTDKTGAMEMLARTTPGMSWRPYWPSGVATKTKTFAQYVRLYECLERLEIGGICATDLKAACATLDGKPVPLKVHKEAVARLVERPPAGWMRVGIGKGSRWVCSA